jgi:hypothetical protein
MEFTRFLAGTFRGTALCVDALNGSDILQRPGSAVLCYISSFSHGMSLLVAPGARPTALAATPLPSISQFGPA